MARQTKAILEAEVARLGKLYVAEAAKVEELSRVDDWQNERTIDGERAWPLFALGASYVQDWNPKCKHKPSPWQSEGVPAGRANNRSSWGARGFKEWPKNGELEEWSRKLWKGALARDDDYRIANPTDVVLAVTFQGWAVWWLTWFQHETFDVGLDDVDVLNSFDRHCDREKRRAGHEGREPSLMGAEDRWRWTGSEPGGGPDCRSEPPCRCEHCKADGLIRIGH